MGHELGGRFDQISQPLVSNEQSVKCEQMEHSTASRALFDQAKSLEETATRLSEMAQTLRGRASLPAIESGADFTLLERARLNYRARRIRIEVLGDQHLATGPAWDILLDMYVCLQLGRPNSISDAAIAASCPPTTGLRWVNALCDANLIEKAPDPNDHRRTFLRLTDLGLDRIKRSLQSYSNEN